jgi:hypothetical protein
VRRPWVALMLVLAFALAGCSGGDEVTEDVTVPVPPSATNDVRIYFLRDGKVWPVLREVPKERAQANAALEELFAGPTEQEATELGLTTAVPDGTETVSLLAPPGGRRGAASLVPSRHLPLPARAQVAYTLTQFPLLEAVIFGSKTYRRSGLEDFTPAILVESPLAFDEVPIPVHVFGTANTFEANFAYELTDTDGRIVDEDFVTATSGTGTRGRFQFTTDEFTVPFDGVGSLIVFEHSAKDGSRINLVEIPLRMTR